MSIGIRTVAAPDDIDGSVGLELGRKQIFQLSLGDTRNVLAQASHRAVPVLDELVAVLRSDSLVLMPGAPVGTDETLMLMCHYVGALVPAVERPVAYLDHVKPGTADFQGGKEAPLSRQRNSLMPHTDQSARGNPPDYLALACVKNEGENGGESILVPVEPIAQAIKARDPHAYDLLQDAVYPIFNTPKYDWASTGPLLRVRQGKNRAGEDVEYHEMRFRDRGVRAAFEVMPVPSPEHVAAFELLSRYVHDEARWLVHKLQPGEVVLFDNARVLHGRTAIDSRAERDLKRLNGNFWPEHAPMVRSMRRLVTGI